MHAGLCESQISFRRGRHLPAAAPAATERHLYFAQLSLFRFVQNRVRR
jgi:hypothetical protein